MIINTGGRTDTVQYYTEWLLNRFSEGYALSRNPLFPKKISRYELDQKTTSQFFLVCMRSPIDSIRISSIPLLHME